MDDPGLIETTAGQTQGYHDGMLIFKVRSGGPMAAAAAASPAPADSLGSPGLSALATLERAGLVKQVVPLSAPDTGAPPPMGMSSAAASIAASAAPPIADDPNAGVNLIELERDDDVIGLQMSLANDPGIESVSRVPVRYLLAKRTKKSDTKSEEAAAPVAPAAVPPPASTMWNLQRIRWQDARSLPNFKDASDIRVGVLDTGVQPDHPDLDGCIVDYVSNYTSLISTSSDKDMSGHGTHVAGTICANANNFVGINGICHAQVSVWKIFDDRPDFIAGRNVFGYFVHPIMYRLALAACLRRGMDVINLSIGGTRPPDFLERFLFNQLLANGTTVVAAMGNEQLRGNPIMYPAAIPGVIAVGATKLNDRITSFSSTGNHISLCAPGQGIWSTYPTYPGQGRFTNAGTINNPVVGMPIQRDTDYQNLQGTSMASPHVAAAALLIANHGPMDGAAVRARLMETADKVFAMNGRDFTSEYGAGRLNLLRLLS